MFKFCIFLLALIVLGGTTPNENQWPEVKWYKSGEVVFEEFLLTPEGLARIDGVRNIYYYDFEGKRIKLKREPDQ